MELTYDWRSFQGMFYPRRRASALQSSVPIGPVYLVVEKDLIVQAFAEHEDLSDWIGAALSDVSDQSKHREMIVFERSEVERWLSGALSLTHFYEQIEHLRSNAKPRSGKRVPCLSQRHFLLEGILGWWSKVLPSAYGVFIRIEGAPQDQELIILVRRGAFAGFHEPDLTSIGMERRRQPEEVVKYLSEKYLVPVQGVFVSAQDWVDWSASTSPWKDVAKSVRTNRARMMPFRWSLATMIATRAFFGL